MQEIEEGTIRRRLRAVVAAPNQHQRPPVGGLGADGFGERRLANSRVTADQYQASVAFERSRELFPEDIQLPRSPDEDRRLARRSLRRTSTAVHGTPFGSRTITGGQV